MVKSNFYYSSINRENVSIFLEWNVCVLVDFYFNKYKYSIRWYKWIARNRKDKLDCKYISMIKQPLWHHSDDHGIFVLAPTAICKKAHCVDTRTYWSCIEGMKNSTCYLIRAFWVLVFTTGVWKHFFFI